VSVVTTAVGGGSPQTDAVSVQSNLVYYPNPLPLRPPAPPTNFSGSGGDGKISLNWTASGTATSYNVYRSTTAGAETNGPPINKNPLSSTSYIDTGLTNGTPYFYVVRAVNGAGMSDNSAEITATPKQ
jgi:cellulose 1,4-beta-cellobiosidase